jgi:hypothetical protein
MELRNAFKLRFKRHHTIHQVSLLQPVPISIELFPREREREWREEGKAKSKNFFFPGQLEQASDISFLFSLKNGPCDQGRGKKWGNCSETSVQVNE